MVRCKQNGVIIKSMQTIHIPEAEAARNFSALMAHIRAGSEVVIEDHGETVAVVSRPAKRPGKLLSEVIALMEAQNSTAIVDEDFARDIESVIAEHREPLDPPAWD
jgi:antitoxin (DNA-binding transcriptional repressor) of toxin-antitoxin stability system